ncbi:MAG: DMT family transporter [Treponema sp.]|jgi:drug/metabolite transporter (DMT)-like permease|nr:DMT family transporter [Treponema sp.]
MDAMFQKRKSPVPPNQGLGQLAIALCAICWSTSGLFIKLLNWHSVVIAGGRSFIAALFMLTIRYMAPPKKAPAYIRGKNHILVTAAGGCCYAGAMITFVIANKLTASANVILLQYSAPVWACLLAWLLIKEKPSWEHWTALVLVGGGMILFFKDGLETRAVTGDIIAVISGIFFGANSVFMRMQKDGNPADSMLLSHIVTALFAVPFFIMFFPTFTLPATAAITFMGIVQIGCASLLFSYGIKRVNAIQAMLTASIEPVLNPLWVLIVMGEMPSSSALLGGAVILFAVIFSSTIRPIMASIRKY